MHGIMDGKTAFIVGGSSGIGLAAAERFAALGSHVAIFARGEDGLKKAVDRISTCKKTPDQHMAAYSMDVTDSAGVTAVMDRAVQELGAPHVLVNSAGRAIPRYFQDISAGQFEDTLRVNVCGVRHAVAALVPHMRQQGGHIVNVSSVAGLIGVFGYTDYSASKFAVIGFSEALRAELKPLGISVSVLCPPDTDTPGLAAENRTKPPETFAISKNAKIMQPWEVADAMIRGMFKGRFLILPGLDSKLSALAKRLFPGLVAFVLDRAAASVEKD